jgi:hypothetical protein
MTEEEEEGQVDGKEGHELGVRGWHAVALAKHFCNGQSVLRSSEVLAITTYPSVALL